MTTTWRPVANRSTAPVIAVRPPAPFLRRASRSLSIVVYELRAPSQRELMTAALRSAFVGSCQPCSRPDALPEAVRRFSPHLVLIGFDRRRPSALVAAKNLLAVHHSVNIALVGALGDTATVAAAVAVGVRSCLPWNFGPLDLAAAVSFAALAPVPSSAPGDLTAREFQVLTGMAAGHGHAQIGDELGISIDTVKTHRQSLFHKLGVRNRAHAVAVGLRTGLIS